MWKDADAAAKETSKNQEKFIQNLRKLSSFS